MTVTLSHKICLEPTHKQEQYFSKASGSARFTWAEPIEIGFKTNRISVEKTIQCAKTGPISMDL